MIVMKTQLHAQIGPNPSVVVPVLTAAQVAGTADSYASIQAALTLCGANPYLECYIPAGTFVVSGGLTCASNACHIEGSSVQGTSITEAQVVTMF